MKKRLFIGMVFAMIFIDGYSQAVGTPFFPFSLPKGLVMSKTGRIWMDKNLGATRVATSPTDSASFGFYFQWGRGADGHQERLSIPYNYDNNHYLSNVWKNSIYPWREGSNMLSGANYMTNAIENFNRVNPESNAKYITQSFSDSPDHNYFIHIREVNDLNSEFEYNSIYRSNVYKFTEYDWRFPSNDELWQGVDGTNNPCPPKFRLPTSTEWEEEVSTWNAPSNENAAFSSPLKLPAASYRDGKQGYIEKMYRGAFSGNDVLGNYWTSTVVNTQSTYSINGETKTKTKHFAKSFYFRYWYDEYAENPDYVFEPYTNSIPRSYGLSIRCILDDNYLPRDLTFGDYSIFSDYGYWHR